MRRCYWAIVALAVVTLILPVSVQADKGDKPKFSELMKRKLTHSQKLLEALAINDFAALSKNADELMVISKEAEWRVVKSPRYELFSDQFRSHAEDIIKHAKDKNLDGAALAYVELTLSCVRCHQYVREMRRTDAGDAQRWDSR